MGNPDIVYVDGEAAYKYVDNENYYITKTGVLYSIYVKGAHGKTDINKIRRVAYGQDKNGYYRVVLSDNGDRQYIKIHQIVTNQFIGRCSGDMVINHKDGNKHNNSVENLEIITATENIKHAWDTGLTSKEQNPNRIAVDVYDHITNHTYHFTSMKNAHDSIPEISIRYIRYIKNNHIGFNLCLFKKIVTGTGHTDYYVECYYNGMLYKTFQNNTEAGKEFGRPANSVSGAYKTETPKKLNRYTITFPNVSTIENTAC